ncbi:MAG: cysteine desulfurase [Mollicutes bacterium]|nr:cysteine desulfurase [Mollicutes bacterium]
MKDKNDFPMKDKNIVYFDNAATTFKPYRVINKINEYYLDYNANSHRGDYDISFKVDDEIDYTRDLVKMFINAKRKDEIIFTKNTTESLNIIAFGFFLNYLNDGDEIILSSSEHASNILPWLILSAKKKIKIVFVDSKDEKLNIEDIKEKITSKTRLISIAEITNVSGDKRDIKTICKLAHKCGILVVVDAAQSAPHIKIDVQDTGVDFIAFSAHKMCGPTGVGVLYGKMELLKKMVPYTFGGGMNENYNEEHLELVEIPYRFESGTPNIADIIGFSEAIKFLNEIGMDTIERKEKYLRKYLIDELEKIPYIKIYNKNNEGSTVIINIDGIMSGDLGLYLNTKGICVRSGKHCAKMGDNKEDTVRISLYFYNTYEEIDILIDALKNKQEIYNFAGI